MAKVGIIGGSGLYDIEGIENLNKESLYTPFGEPSCNFILGELDGTQVVFLPRHGHDHRLLPGEINYRANIFGMKKLGVDAIVSVSACGSLKEEIKPMDFVVPDQFLDLTKGRASTFFGGGLVGHIPFAEPISPELRPLLMAAIKESGSTGHDGGTYVNMEGPQFSTRAESHLYRSWGMDIIGMTNATEAKLAREAEIAYITLAAVTDYDCWHPDHASVTVDVIIDYLKQNIQNAKEILKIVIPRIGEFTDFGLKGATRGSIVTAEDHIPEAKMKELEIIFGDK